MNLSRRFVGWFAPWCCIAVTFTVASATVQAALPTVAFVDFDKTTVGGVLEARLLAKPGYQWLERSQIDAVLKEQQTQALFSPAGVADRAAFGRLLKAEVLVLLRTAAVEGSKEEKAAASGRRIDLVICETRRGLRLAVHSSTDDDATAAARLESQIVESLRHVDRPAADICAVPPFLSGDLTFTHDYLKRAYAAVAEQTVFQHGGLAVVELAEAEALAKELLLAGENPALERRLPLYVLGEYRNSDDGASRRVRIRLQLVRGKQQIAAEEKELPPAAVGEFLQQTVAAMLRKVSPDQGVVYDAALEAKQLAERAREFTAVGNYDDAMPLFESALLLKPDDHDVRREAIIIAGKMGHRFFLHSNDPVVAIPSMRIFRRGMDHLETWLTAHPEVAPPNAQMGARTFVDEFRFEPFMINPPQHAEIRPVYDELRREIDAQLLRLTELRLRQGARDAYRFLSPATWRLPSRDRYRLIGETILRLQDLPETARQAPRLILGSYTAGRLNEDGGTELLASLAAARNPELRVVANNLLKARQEALTKPSPFPERTVAQTHEGEPKLPEGPTKVTFLRGEFDARSAAGSTLFGCLPANPGIDVFWSGKRLFVMKEKHVLRKVWEGPELNDRFRFILARNQYSGSFVSFDGRYVWATVSRLRLPPLLLVLDPVTETIREITPTDGLPIVDMKNIAKEENQQVMGVAAFAPGRALVVGGFGRSWMALVTVADDGKHDVRLIREFRKVPDAIDVNHWRDLDMAYDPTFMTALHDPQTGEKRVVVGRGTSNYLFDSHPLIVDPVRETVEVFQGDMGRRQHANGLAIRDGAMYFVDYDYKANRDVRICRFGGPSWQVEPLAHNVPQGWAVIVGDDLHIVGKRWWTRRLPDGPLHVAAADVPWTYNNIWAYPGATVNPDFKVKIPLSLGRLEDVYYSHHYGVLLLSKHNQDPNYRLHQAAIQSP